MRDGAIAARNGLIVSVGSAADVCAAHPDLPVRPLGDVVAIPGLVDAHCHLEWSLMEGLVPSAAFGSWLRAFLPIRARMAPDHHLAAARYGALRALKAGTTTVADSGPLGSGVDALKEVGLAGVVHLEAFGRESGEKARELARATADRILELEAGAGARIALGLSPHAPYTVGPEFWSALAENSDLAERPWATHLAESPDETLLLSHDEGQLADLFREQGWQPGRWSGSGGTVSRIHAGGGLRAGLVAAHCVRLDPGDPELLAQTGVSVAHCPESNARLRCGRAPVEALVAAGVTVGIGTDSPASAGMYDVRAEARAMAREAEAAGVAAPNAATLVSMATLGGAMAVGLDHEIGSLEAGKRCDFVAVGLVGDGGNDPFSAALDARSRVETVVIGGIERVRGGSAIYVDEENIEHRAGDARTRIGRVPG